MDVNPGEAEAVQVGEGMQVLTVIKIKRAECCLAMGPGQDYCPAKNNIIRVRRLKECPLFRQYFVLTKVLSSCTFTMALATWQKDDGGSIAVQS